MAVRVRRAAWVGIVLALSATAHAVVPRTSASPRVAADALTAMPAAGLKQPLRIQPTLRYGEATPSFAWSRFVTQRGTKWQASWDAATGVPNRIWGSGIWVPGSVANADVAEQFARQLLADHIALLAPGAAASDFVLASNRFDGRMRTVGFYQYVGGKRVIGGQVSFRFKNDHMFVIGSEALPNVALTTDRGAPKAKLAPARMRELAASALRSELALPAAPVAPLGDEVIVPLVGNDTVLGYRLARPTEIDGGGDGRYLAYVDVATGAPLAVRQMNTYATGTVLYNTVDRYPLTGRARIARPAPRTFIQLNGASMITSTVGAVTWSPEATASVVTSVSGDLMTIVNKAGDHSATATLGLSPGDALVWDAEAAVEEDAQINAYIATGIVKDYVRANLDPTLPTLDTQMIVNVNINQTCNAFWDGKAINFFKALPPADVMSKGCQNTGLLHDVVFHEYGHHVHGNEVIPGVGDFDSAMSEGAADFLAASITNDQGMGRGFFFDDAPLRELDPDGKEWMWPIDVGEVHHTGQIYGGIFWDLRKQLITDLGEGPGIALVNKLYVGTLRRAVSIPSALIESLAEDDDDGNLANGTPHECQIRAAFGRHGLRTATGNVIAPGALETQALAIGIHIEVTGLSENCTGDEVMGATLHWRSYTGDPPKGSMDATPAGPNKFFAQLPLAKQDSVLYQAIIKFVDGSTLTLPDNWADDEYQLYSGPTVKLYCSDFETTDPFTEGWTAGTDNSEEHQWQWGVPTGGPSDPRAAFSGTKILALNLEGDYAAKQRTWIKTPTVNIGQYSDVRLHYRRWLAVEDHHFDQALITANGNKAWNNYDSDQGDSSAKHHIDKEWRFQDVALSPRFRGHSVQVGWEITSDEGLELGGWQLDDVCIVANPYAICGDGVRTATEQCDTGADNQDKPDVCRTDCHLPTCGDGILDMTEECDEGSNSPSCDDKCKTVEGDGSGCCSASGGAGGSFALASLIGLVLRRRRRPSP